MQQVRVVVIKDRTGPLKLKTVASPLDAFRLLAQKAVGLDREHFWAVHLSVRHVPIAVETVSIGTLSASLVHMREVFKAAIIANAGAIIVAHNHPSTDMDPSPEDLATTNRLVRAGELLGIPVLDHLILDGLGGYSSLKQHHPRLFAQGGLDG